MIKINNPDGKTLYEIKDDATEPEVLELPKKKQVVEEKETEEKENE